MNKQKKIYKNNAIFVSPVTGACMSSIVFSLRKISAPSFIILIAA